MDRFNKRAWKCPGFKTPDPLCSGLKCLRALAGPREIQIFIPPIQITIDGFQVVPNPCCD